MTRCPMPPNRRARPTLPAAFLALAALLAFAPAPVFAQMHGELGGVRTFPVEAKRATLTILSTVEAQLDGKPVRMAPGMRLLSPQNALVMLHSVIGQKFIVNYRIEGSSGMLLTAWVLSKAEIALPRAGSGEQRNFTFETDASPRQ